VFDPYCLLLHPLTKMYFLVSPDDTHEFLRSVLAKLYDEEVAQAVRIQYGGSVTPDSVDGLMSMPEIDGCLVGGASLVADAFGRIINYKKV
jgi:triosephosphate isomerase (TIM)